MVKVDRRCGSVIVCAPGSILTLSTEGGSRQDEPVIGRKANMKPTMQ